MNPSKFFYTLGALVIALALAVIVAKDACVADAPGVVLTDNKPGSSSAILFSPFRIDAGGSFRPGSLYLIAENGTLLHSWSTNAPVLTSILEPNGDVWVSKATSKNVAFPDPGTTGTIERMSWSGETLWEYSDPEMMIDFDVLPDSSVAYLRWSTIPENRANGARWSNEIVVVNPSKDITWTWKFSDYVGIERFEGSFVNPLDTVHANSIRYVAENPLTKTPAFLVSARHLSTVYMIDIETKKVLWQSPRGVFSYQHDASLVDDGSILVFDNGFARARVGALLSRVVEIDPKSEEVLWRYDGGKTITGKAGFASSVMGAAQRLSNGNTLITLSTRNLLTEVDRTGNIVWEYQFTERDEDQELPIVFRARHYDINSNQWGKYVSTRRLLCGGF